MKQILGTGLSGLVGSRIIELLSSQFEFADLSYDTGVDITNLETVLAKVGQSQANWILHLAAKADVDGCEKDKVLGELGPAWQINVGGTQNIVAAAQKYNKRVIYISTDFVFDGTQESYSETDTPNPLNWYGQTKYEGEKIVLSNRLNTVMRIAYPYRAQCPTKQDFVHSILFQFNQQKPVPGVTDHIVTPTFIDDIAAAVTTVIEKNASGLYHVTGSTSITPFAAAQEIAHVFELKQAQIQATTRAAYYRGRANRPFKLAIKNAKIAALGVDMKPFNQGLLEVKTQLSL